MTEEAELSAMSQRHPPCSAGFSLIEILVGLGIGMIGIIVIMQVFILSEGQRRTTSSGGDAQTTGAIALYTMERDIRQGGYGLASLNLLGCNLTFPNGAAVPAIPVIINPAGIPAGDANTDVIEVLYGNANTAAEGDAIISQAGAVYTVRTPSNFTDNDYVFVLPTSACPALTLTRISPGQSTTTTVTVLAAQAGATLFNLGQRPRALVYAVRNGNLTVCDFVQSNCTGGVGDNTVWSPVAEGIVNLRAEYGRDTSGPPMDGSVDIFDQTTPTTACGWARASALRLVLVARSGQYDKNDVVTTAPVWAGTATTPIDLSGDANWRHYRYKLFQTVVPVRNVAWMGVQAGC